jgi:hypothetical protein
MQAIRTLFVAIAGIQMAMDNPFPRLVAWVALAGQLVVPVLSMLQKYWQQGQNIFVISAAISSAVVILSTSSVTLQPLPAAEVPAIKMKAFLALILSTLAFIGISRLSAELAIAAYLVFALSPLKKLLKVESDSPEPR